ncbi:MAG: hypothetical protein P4L98_15720 [Ancalomicrobiaceae bacterium]|nr:hypothetical protein [Ancalomicrobiaceae bacterium]
MAQMKAFKASAAHSMVTDTGHQRREAATHGAPMMLRYFMATSARSG